MQQPFQLEVALRMFLLRGPVWALVALCVSLCCFLRSLLLTFLVMRYFYKFLCGVPCCKLLLMMLIVRIDLTINIISRGLQQGTPQKNL
jgi:hypothetical protein